MMPATALGKGAIMSREGGLLCRGVGFKVYTDDDFDDGSGFAGPSCEDFGKGLMMPVTALVKGPIMSLEGAYCGAGRSV